MSCTSNLNYSSHYYYSRFALYLQPVPHPAYRPRSMSESDVSKFNNGTNERDHLPLSEPVPVSSPIDDKNCKTLSGSDARVDSSEVDRMTQLDMTPDLEKKGWRSCCRRPYKRQNDEDDDD